MRLCKACNTRFGEGPSACPSCGRRVFSELGGSPAPTAARPDPLPAARRLEGDIDGSERRLDSDTQVDVELDEVDVLAGAVDPAAADELKSELPVAARPAARESRPAARDPRPAAARRGMREPGPAVFHLSAAQVRTLVAEQPDLLEPGLGIFTDESGQPVGVDHRTPVGAIDLLARDAAGGLVVVMVPDARDAESLMPQVLGRVGYVRKHLADAGQPVRGVVVIEEIPEALAYAAAGVSDTISFKAYRVALTFHHLEL